MTVFFASCAYIHCSSVMASHSHLQEDLRRRPVRSGNTSRIGEEVETTRDPVETQKQRVITPGIFEIVTAFFLHLIVLGFYVYVHVYDSTVYEKNEGMGFPGSETFGGRWKSLTYINMVINSCL